MSFLFLDSYLKRKYFNFILKQISKIRVLGFSIKNYMEDVGFKNKIYVINNGISVQNNIIYKKDINQNCVNFLYLGAISENKGFKKVMDIFTKIERAGLINWKLNVVGELVNFNERAKYYDAIVKNGLREKIINIMKDYENNIVQDIML
jgi:glycosyltransferase involved in cell wall biosynthesis